MSVVFSGLRWPLWKGHQPPRGCGPQIENHCLKERDGKQWLFCLFIIGLFSGDFSSLRCNTTGRLLILWLFYSALGWKNKISWLIKHTVWNFWLDVLNIFLIPIWDLLTLHKSTFSCLQTMAVSNWVTSLRKDVVQSRPNLSSVPSSCIKRSQGWQPCGLSPTSVPLVSSWNQGEFLFSSRGAHVADQLGPFPSIYRFPAIQDSIS